MDLEENSNVLEPLRLINSTSVFSGLRRAEPNSPWDLGFMEDYGKSDPDRSMKKGLR